MRANQILFSLHSVKQILFNKNLLIADKMMMYRKAKSEINHPPLEMIDMCLIVANQCFRSKRELEFGECLNDLKAFCSQMNDEMEKNLSGKNWNYIIQHFSSENPYQNQALYWFNRIMKEKKIASPTCANSYLYEEGKNIHSLILNTIHDFSIELSTAIVNFYTKCGHPEIAIEEYKLRRKKSVDLIWWNSILQAFVLYDFNQSIQIFQEMQMNILPDKFTYVILLVGCGDHVATLIGKRIVSEIIENGMEVYEEISSAMVYFYFRIGESEMAEELFETLVKQGNESNMNLSIITFNNMLSCYAQYGRVQEAISLFNSMIGKKIDPNQKTFSIMLNAFSHCGMIQEAIELYGQINSIYGQETNLITTTAMVDVLARAGKFQEAEQLIDGKRDFVLWNTLMGACRKFNNLEFGEKVFKVLLEIDKSVSSSYILMSHIYTFHNMHEKTDLIRNLMERNGIKKIPAIVYHEENGKLYKFLSGSPTLCERYQEVEHMREEIYRKIIKAGFQPDSLWVSSCRLMSEDEKIDSLSRHAEKTAIAHAFVLNPNRKKIILRSNIRMCNDCHNATGYISKVMNVEIIIKDGNRYHHFKNGRCCCNDFW